MTKDLGTFTLTAPTMRVSDPCYDKKTWCAGTFPAKPGTWRASIETSDEGGWGRRVSKLLVLYESYIDQPLAKRLPIDVGVDSGQCGFFDEAKYPEGAVVGEYDDPTSFYGAACAATLSEDRAGTVSGFGKNFGPIGVASSSGFGDGSYVCNVAEVDGLAVAAEVVFIDDSEEDEDEPEDEEEERAANVEDGDDMGEGEDRATHLSDDERMFPRDEPESPGFYHDEDGAHKY